MKIICSCGSGNTACAGLFAAHLLNRDEKGSVCVYDGSWSEYGGKPSAPYEKS